MTCHDTYPYDGTTAAPEPRIVVGVDGSPASVAALRWSHAEAARTGARLEVVNVYQSAMPYAFTISGMPPLSPVDPARVGMSASQVVRDVIAAAGLRDSDVDDCITVDDPNPARALDRLSEHATLLVVGAHQQHGLGRMLGSTASACVRHASCPVVVVPALAADESHPAAH